MSDVPQIIDVAVIGSGPAGMTAGLYAARAGLSTRIFEALAFGGQLAQTSELENYPGFVQQTGGFQLAMDMKKQAESFGAAEISQGVVSADLAANPKVIRTSTGEYLARAVIVATGSRPRKLGVPGEAELTGKGVSYCATCDGFFFRGKDVLVVGGGDTAAADALYLSRICNRVVVVHRRDALRAAHSYREQLSRTENVEFVWNSVVDRLVNENGMVAGAVVRNLEDGTVSTIAASGVFVAIGTVPNVEFLGDALEQDQSGYLITDEDGRTSVPGVFAAGDVRAKTLRQVTTAVGDGANAATAAAEYLQ